MKIEDVVKKLKDDTRNKDYTNREVGPIFQLNKDSKILIIGQAPGKKVEKSGILFNDKSGDKAPRKFIAKEYHPLLLEGLKNIKLTILIGAYAQKFYLKDDFNKNLTETVRNFKDYLPEYFPIVHPSPLNNRWIAKNTFFKEETLPELKKIIQRIL